jgi:hypothetical protein
MKVTKVSVVLVLSLVLVCGFQSLAAAQLLKKSTQLANFTAPLGGGEWTRVMPDGTTVTPYIIPAKKLLVINSYTMRFVPQGAFTGTLRLLIKDPDTGTTFFARNLTSTTDDSGNVIFASGEYVFEPGLALGKIPNILVVDFKTGLPVTPSDSGVRVFGIAP